MRSANELLRLSLVVLSMLQLTIKLVDLLRTRKSDENYEARGCSEEGVRVAKEGRANEWLGTKVGSLRGSLQIDA